MSNIQNVSVPIAAQHKTKLDLSCDHLTTMNFMQMQPVYYRHMIKGESINLSTFAKAQLMPMQLPVLSKMRLNLRAFFVPFRLVFPKADAFFADTLASGNVKSGLVTSEPKIKNSVLVNLFYDTVSQHHGLATIVQATATNPDPVYDFKIFDSNLDNPVMIKLTTKGKAFVKVLWSLGYRWNWNMDDETEYSALGLLSFARVYYDWYTNSSYLDTNSILALDRAFNYNEPDLYYVSVTLLESILDLAWIVQYDNDAYFNAAWDNPMSPISTQQSIFTFNDVSIDKVNDNYQGYVTNDRSSTVENRMNTPVMRQTTSTYPYLGTQYLHDALKALQNFSKRHQLSGARVIDRTLADWGFGSNALNCSRSIYVGAQSIDIDTGQVLSTANTSTDPDVSNLGTYAGAGRAAGSKSWQFECDEFGLFVVTASIVPLGSIVQGCDRNNLKQSKFDFFNPSLDGLATQAISRREIYMSPNGDFGGRTGEDYDDGVFGFVGRYGEMKRPISWLTGDASLQSLVAANAWNMFRLFSDESFVDSSIQPSAAAIVHSLDFTRGSDWQQYNRIFNYTSADFDKFIVNFHFAVGSFAPCRPLFETYDFDELGKQITLAANGSKVN